MDANKKAENYDLMIIRIDTFLKAYKDILIESQDSLIYYQKQEMDELIELKKEHCDFYKGKIEVLTDLKKAL